MTHHDVERDLDAHLHCSGVDSDQRDFCRDLETHLDGLELQNSPIAGKMADGNAFDFLPMWRWTWVSELWTDWEGTGVFDFGRKLMNATWGVLLEMLFMLSALLWEITSTVLYLTLDLNFMERAPWDHRQAGQQRPARSRNGRQAVRPTIWAGIGALAFVLAAWRLFREGASRAVRTVLGTFIPLAVIAAMANASLSEQQAIAADQSGLTTWGTEPGSPVWVLTKARNHHRGTRRPTDRCGQRAGRRRTGRFVHLLRQLRGRIGEQLQGHSAPRRPRIGQVEVGSACADVEAVGRHAHDHLRRGAVRVGVDRETGSLPVDGAPNPGPAQHARNLGHNLSWNPIPGTYREDSEGRLFWTEEPPSTGPFAEREGSSWSEMRPLFACDSGRVYDPSSDAAARAIFNPPKIRSDESHTRAFLTLISLCDYSDPRGAWNDYQENPSIFHPRTMQHYLAETKGKGSSVFVGTGTGGWQEDQTNHLYSDARAGHNQYDNTAANHLRYVVSYDGGRHWAWINTDYRNLGGLDDHKDESEFFSAGVCAAFLTGEGESVTTGGSGPAEFGGIPSSTTRSVARSIVRNQIPGARLFVSPGGGSAGAGMSTFVHDRSNFHLGSVSEWEEDALGSAIRSGHGEDFTNTWGLLAYPTGEELERAIGGMERLHGRNSAIGRAILAIMALVTAAAYMFSLIGLAAGAVLSQFILAIIIILLPVILLVIAMPFASTKQIAPRLLKLSFGALMAYGVFYLILTLVLVVTLVLADVIAAASDPGSWERMLGIALVPIVAIKSVAWLFKQVGLNITGFKGALAATSGMAMAAMAPTGLDKAQQYGRRIARRGQGLLHEQTRGGSRYGDLNMRAGPGLLGAAAGGASVAAATGVGSASGIRGVMGQNKGWDGIGDDGDGGNDGDGGDSDTGGDGERGGVDLAGGLAGFKQTIATGRRQMASSKKWLKQKSAASSSFVRRHRKKLKAAAYVGGLATGVAPVVLGAMLAGKVAYRMAVPRYTRIRKKEQLKREKRKRLDEKIEKLEAKELASDPKLREERRKEELENKYQEFAAKRQAKEEEEEYFKNRDKQEGRGGDRDDAPDAVDDTPEVIDNTWVVKERDPAAEDPARAHQVPARDRQEDWRQDEEQQRYEGEDWDGYSGQGDQGSGSGQREGRLPRGDFDPGRGRVARAQPHRDEYNKDWQPPKNQRANPPNPNAGPPDSRGRG